MLCCCRLLLRTYLVLVLSVSYQFLYLNVHAMVFSKYTKQRILSLHWSSHKVSTIVEYLVLEDGIRVSKVGVRRFIHCYTTRGTIARQPGSGFPPRLTPEIQTIIEGAMREDDETTTTQLQSRLAVYGVYVSLATILRGRQKLGWIYRGSAYCQLIRTVNKQKRLEWATMYLHDNFEDVIWSDETTIQLETHRRFCCRKVGEKPRLKPCPKHPVKVHVFIE